MNIKKFLIFLSLLFLANCSYYQTECGYNAVMYGKIFYKDYKRTWLNDKIINSYLGAYGDIICNKYNKR